MISLRKSAVVGLTVAGLGAGLLAAACPASAAPAPSTAYTAQLGLPGATALAVADNHLFISLHNNVYVRDLAGHPVTTIGTAESELSSLLASPDGTTVFAADSTSGSISVIDTASLSVRATWTARPCVTSMAIASGRLFFSYGCMSPYGIASLDQATGGSPVASGTTDTFYQAPVIAAANGHLVAGGGTVYSYTASSDGALTEIAKSSFGVDRQVAISPDGSQVAATEMAPYQVVQFDTATMTEDETYPTGAYPNAVAFSGAGNRLAAGLMPSGNSSVQLYDTGTGTELSAIGPADTLGYTRQGIAGTVSFGPDLTGKPDALVYSLAEDYSHGAYLQVASVAPLTIAHLTLALSSPKAWGLPLVASVTFPGHPNTALTLKVLPNSGSPIYVPVRTNQWGVLTAKIGVNFTGRVYAYYGGDLLTRHEAPSASAIQSFTVPTRTSASILGAYRSSGGVLYFHPTSTVRMHILVGPPHVRTVSVTLQQFTGGKWVSRPTVSFTTNQWGAIDLYLKTTYRTPLRTVVVMPSTVFNTGSSAVTQTFAIG